MQKELIRVGKEFSRPGPRVLGRLKYSYWPLRERLRVVYGFRLRIQRSLSDFRPYGEFFFLSFLGGRFICEQ